MENNSPINFKACSYSNTYDIIMMLSVKAHFLESYNFVVSANV